MYYIAIKGPSTLVDGKLPLGPAGDVWSGKFSGQSTQESYVNLPELIWQWGACHFASNLMACRSDFQLFDLHSNLLSKTLNGATAV
jgi:hypothetical protein